MMWTIAMRLETDALPNQEIKTAGLTGRQWALAVLLCTFVVAAVAAVIGAMWAGSMSAFVQAANGHEMLVDFKPPVIAEGAAVPRNERGNYSIHVPVKIANLGSEARTLLGGTSDCHCVTTAGLPQRIKGGEQTSIDVTIHMGANESAIDHMVTLYTDSPVDPVLTFRINSSKD
jgi:hypothetical protein